MLGQTIKDQLQELSPDSQEPVTTNLFENIELTSEEVQEALRLGRESKHFKIEQEAYWNKINARMEWHMPTARELYEQLRNTPTQSGGRFQITDWNKDVIFNLCLYFAGDPKFEQRTGGKLTQGIMLSGNAGTGKTHLMVFFARNPQQSYIPVTCSLIAERFRTSWERNEQDTLEYYSCPAKADFGHVYGHTELGYCFGDLGMEGG